MPQAITEARQAAETTPVGGGRYLIRLIDAGKGSSGIYPAATLEAAAGAKVFPAGTQMFLDHPGRHENQDRPERSVKDLAAVLTEDARWDPRTKALVAEARVFSTYRTLLNDMADSIGVSIRATAEVEQGEADGMKGLIVTQLLEGISVDFVTRAGRGGKVMSVLESATVAEVTSQERMQQLQLALPPRSYAIDYDPDESWVVYATYSDDREAMWRQQYEADDQSATLTGDPVEVRRVISWTPITQQAATETAPTSPPAAPAGTTTESSTKEMNMAQIDDQELAQLRESAGQVQALTTERDTARGSIAVHRAATERALDALAESNLPARVVKRILREATTDIPTKDGALDVEAFDARLAESRKDFEALITPPAGVTGFGASVTTTESAGSTRPDPWAGRSAVKGA